MKLSHILESQQFTPDMLEELFTLTDSLKLNIPSELLNGKIMCTLFYEPSTRTRFSFESAMNRLGGRVISTEAAGMFSSAVKGESLIDTIRIVDDYADVIVLRTGDDNGAHLAAEVSKVPIINAGEGKYGQHPTQALLDLYTIKKEFGRIDNLHVVIVGDLKNGRTARSLAYLLSKCKGVRISFVSPENLKVEQDMKDYLARHGVLFEESENLYNLLPIADVVYMTRIQKERMSADEYNKANGKFRITEKELGIMKEKSRLLHPLPNAGEVALPLEVEERDPRVAYFRQARNGLYLRMALLKMLLAN
ncbi:aspartate carbamoyltransferase [Candidatus Pacearchaeota archaeon]|nr:aspartate carbamoyltransferase [Candidatus Pacearchaeota archaeon]